MASTTTNPPFEFTVQEIQNATLVTIASPLSDDLVPIAKEKFLEVLKNNPRRLIVDFTRVQEISSSGITLLLSILRRCCQINCWFAIYGLNQSIIAVFKLTHLTKVFNVFEDGPAAFAGR